MFKFTMSYYRIHYMYRDLLQNYGISPLKKIYIFEILTHANVFTTWTYISYDVSVLRDNTENVHNQLVAYTYIPWHIISIYTRKELALKSHIAVLISTAII